MESAEAAQTTEASRSLENRTHSILRGFVAGCIGGFVGGLVKFVCELIVPPRSPDREPPPAILAEHLRGHALSAKDKVVASQAIHWGLSTLTGGAYGALAEAVPLARLGSGTAFGLGFWAVAHELALPALHLTPPVAQLPASEQINESVTHVFYGIGADVTYRLVRPIL